MLPADILDYILSFLQKNPGALRSCSAAHPLLSSLAERHLFAHISIYVDSPRFPTDGFLVSQLSRCLSEKPYLANYIRSITINLFYGCSIDFEELPTILLSIPHAEELCLRNVEWFRLPGTIRSALSLYLRTPHMKSIHLKRTDGFPLAILDDATNIKMLKVDSSPCTVTIKHPRPTRTPNSLEYLFLQVVGVLNLHNIITWAGSRVNSLISLHVKTISLSFPNLSPIFNACRESLRSLTLDIGTLFRTTYRRETTSSLTRPLDGFLFDLSILARLEVVTVYAIAMAKAYPVEGTVTGETLCYSSLPAITQLLGTAGPSLNRVVLNLECAVDGSSLREVMEWKPLIQLCDSLAHIRVDLCIRAYTFSFVEAFESLVGHEDLSRLVEQGSLVIKPLLPPDF